MKYYDNESILCTVCKKPVYMGYTNKNDSELCGCANQNEIPVIDKRGIIKPKEGNVLYMSEVISQLEALVK
tara:strand:- start:4818 stop:5030 length:213 start_codon:yes stop_codon:yes gene_type:complete